MSTNPENLKISPVHSEINDQICKLLMIHLVRKHTLALSTPGLLDQISTQCKPVIALLMRPSAF